MGHSEKLTSHEAYLAMFAFLEELARRDGSDSELNRFLSAMSFLPDGGTADGAMWHDWLKAVQRARSGEVDARLILSK